MFSIILLSLDQARLQIEDDRVAPAYHESFRSAVESAIDANFEAALAASRSTATQGGKRGKKKGTLLFSTSHR